MIPKRIIYCWFGGLENMNALNQKCIESWKRSCPDYEILRINESNFDINANKYTQTAYENKAYAFVSDIARYEALEQYGGFYLDTDIELHKSLNPLRAHTALLCEEGLGMYGSGFMACEAGGNEIYREARYRVSEATPLHIALNDILYDRYDIYGEAIHIEDKITLLGHKYAANPRTLKEQTHETILTHWDQNSWVNGWTGTFQPFSDLIPCIIQVKGERRKDIEWKWFRDRQPEATIVCDTEPDITILETANLLRNPRVMSVIGEQFILQRNQQSSRTCIVREIKDGLFVRHEDSH